MSFPAAFKKKKPAALDLEAPEAFDAPPKPKAAPTMELAEPPAQEAGEDYAAKLMTDIDAVGESMGFSSDQTRQFAGGIFDAMAKCFAGGEVPEPNEAQESEERPDGIY